MNLDSLLRVAGRCLFGTGLAAMLWSFDFWYGADRALKCRGAL